MSSLAQLLAVALITVFAASSVGHAANAAAMSVEMAPAAGGPMDAADCAGCDAGDANEVACDPACVTPYAANLVEDRAFASPIAAAHSGMGALRFADRTGPPDSDPPRSLTLS